MLKYIRGDLMINFTYSSPTIIHFGEGQIVKLIDELKKRNVKNLLFVYGKTAVKKLGIYDKVVEVTTELGISLFEESGVRPNPDITSVYSGISKCKENNIDFIFAAGGGSVVDCAKAIGLGYYYDGDAWDMYVKKGIPGKSLPIGCAITLAATGTETNGNSVISNDSTDEKRSIASKNSVPVFAIIDPAYTLSVNQHFTVAGSIDIIMHILEQYFSNTEDTETSDLMSIGVLKSVIENTNWLLNGKNTYQKRANISWASTIGLNWILGVDKVGDWATHRLSYAITKEYGVTHGSALALIFSSWMKTALKYNPVTMKWRLSLLGSELFGGIEYNEVPDALNKVFNEWGANTCFKDQGINLSDQNIDSLVENALALGNVGTVVDINKEIAKEIFNLAK